MTVGVRHKPQHDALAHSGAAEMIHENNFGARALQGCCTDLFLKRLDHDWSFTDCLSFRVMILTLKTN
jgi:hypothetical protein